MRNKIIHYIRAGYAGLYLVSAEEQRVEAELKSIAEELKFGLYVWSVTTGLMDVAKSTARECNDPLEALLAIKELPEKSICVLRDLHMFLGGDPNPVLVRQFRDALQEGKTKSKTLIVLGCRLALPPELERELTVIEFALPGRAELCRVLDGIIESAKLSTLGDPARDVALDAACGLTTIEAENAFALSVVEAQGVVPAIIAREKAQAVKRNGLLEIVQTKESLASIGGLDVLKDVAAQTQRGVRQTCGTIWAAYAQGAADRRHPWDGQIAHGQGYGQGIRRAAAQAGCRPDLCRAGRPIRIQPAFRDSNRRGDCALLSLDRRAGKGVRRQQKLRRHRWRDLGAGVRFVHLLVAGEAGAGVRRGHRQ